MNTWPANHDPLANANGFADPQLLSVENPQMYAQNGNAVNGVAFQNQQPLAPQHPQTPNNQQRSQTPQQFPYAVPQVVPSKRARPTEDGLVASPGQPPVTMNMSRSQTPQQAGAFPNTFQYQHLQAGGSSNATPSPTMQNQQFRPQAQAQRMQTASPNPQFAQQPQAQGQAQMSMSPTPDPNGRATPQTPQFPMGAQMTGPLAQMQSQMAGQMGGAQLGAQMGMGMPGQMMAQNGVPQPGPHMNPQMAGAFPGGVPPGFNPNFAMSAMNMQGGQPGFPGGQMNMPPNMPTNSVDAQRQYQMRQQMAMQRRMQHAAAMNSGMMQGQPQGMGTPTRPPQPNSQLNATPQSNAVRGFLQNVTTYMQKINRPFDPNPTVSGRLVNLFQLFQLVNRSKGSSTVSAMNQWPKIAAGMGFNEPNAPQELKDVFERCLGPYEVAFVQHQSQSQQKQQGVPGQHLSPTRRVSQPPQAGQQQKPPGPEHPQMKPQGPPPPGGHMTPVQAHSELSMPAEFEAMNNGWATPQTDKAPNSAIQQRKSIPRSQENTPDARQPEAVAGGAENIVPEKPVYPDDCYEPDLYFEEKKYGGINVEALAPIGHDIVKYKPRVPEPEEMGFIDIRAIALSLQSGITREVRYALDVLIKLSDSRYRGIDLEQCEDLLDILVDCGEDQLETLSKDSTEVSDVVYFPSYEDIVRKAVAELHTLQDISEAGTTAYDLDRAAERLLAITTILRHLSFKFPIQTDKNKLFLAAEHVIKFISNAIHFVGTRQMFLRSYFNTQDFMKDVVVFLSNVADRVALSSREDARNMLYFLLSFGPQLDPSASDELRFSFYHPLRYRYYPPAIDSFAKLILIDDPNRDYFRSIFNEPSLGESSTESSPVAADATSELVYQKYSLLTRAFGLAIAVLPDRTGIHLPDETLVRLREATLSQGLLAADIIAGLLPTSPASAGPALARSWLGSQDCWVSSLMHLCRSIFNDPSVRHQEGRRAVMNRALGMLRTLATLGLGKSLPHKKERSGQIGAAAESPEPALNGDLEGDEGSDLGVDGGIMNGTAHVGGDDWRQLWDGINADILPNWNFVIGALNMTSMDTNVLRNLIALASLDE